MASNPHGLLVFFAHTHLSLNLRRFLGKREQFNLTQKSQFFRQKDRMNIIFTTSRLRIFGQTNIRIGYSHAEIAETRRFFRQKDRMNIFLPPPGFAVVTVRLAIVYRQADIHCSLTRELCEVLLSTAWQEESLADAWKSIKNKILSFCTFCHSVHIFIGVVFF